MAKKVLIISTSIRANSNSEILAAAFADGAREAGNEVECVTLKDKTIALWGLAFKPETDDMREAPSIITLDLLTEIGCKVRVYDPVAMNATKRRWGNVYCGVDMYDAVKGADAVLLLTEWRQFRIPAWDRVKELMRTPVVIDGRNIYDYRELEEQGFTYYCIGR